MTGKTGTLVAVLAGAAIGAGLGILFAPDQGANTRRKIREGYGTKKGELKDKLNETD
jgi:gas vesicle protein